MGIKDALLAMRQTLISNQQLKTKANTIALRQVANEHDTAQEVLEDPNAVVKKTNPNRLFPGMKEMIREEKKKRKTQAK